MEGKQCRPKFSLIVASVGRTEPLRELLRSLAHETVRDFEVIVVDQNPDDRVEVILQEYRDVLSITHLRSEPGLSKARNAGVRLAKGEILAFPDDDCRYTGVTLETVKHAFEMEPIDIICGLYGENHGTFVPHPKYLGWRSTLLKPHNILFLVSSVGLFVKRRAIEDLLEEGPFNENMGAGSHIIIGEEQEFVARLLAKGFQGKFLPSVRVYHRIERAKPRLEVEYAHSVLLVRLFKVSRSPLLLGRLVGRMLKAFAELLLSSEKRLFYAKVKGLIDGLKLK